jgi:hypothetical protein
MESATNPGYKTSEFYTMLLGNLLGALLASGVITQSQAASATNQLPVIGAIILFVVSTGGYIANRFFLKLKNGPVPTFAPPVPSAGAPPGANAPASPSYAPPSTGSEPTPLPPDFPASAV